MFGLRLISPPAEEPVTLDMARLHCRIDHQDDDALLDTFISAAREQVEQMTGRALVTQTWEVTADAPAGERSFWLPKLPVQAILGVSSTDGQGAVTALDPTAYRPALSAGLLTPVSSWQGQALTVTFRAGYGGQDAVPKALQAAILLGVSDLYEHREATVERGLSDNPTFMRLIAPYRVWAP